jgi:hypothetical protein
MSKQPAPDDRFGEPRALFARCRCREIAEPGEALQLLGDRTVGADRSKIEIGQGNRFTAAGELALQQSVAPSAIALHMIARHGDETKPLPARPGQARQQRPAGKLLDNGRLSRVRTHPSPRSALMLEA